MAGAEGLIRLQHPLMPRCIRHRRRSATRPTARSACRGHQSFAQTKKKAPTKVDAFFLAGAEGLIRLRYPKKSLGAFAHILDFFDRGTRLCLAVSATGGARQRAPRHAPRAVDTNRLHKQKKKAPTKVDAFFFGRGRRTRTLGTRFWRPLLYQLSYAPIWWAFRDLNPGPTGYEPVALTN